jgi:hypothetical protein
MGTVIPKVIALGHGRILGRRMASKPSGLVMGRTCCGLELQDTDNGLAHGRVTWPAQILQYDAAIHPSSPPCMVLSSENIRIRDHSIQRMGLTFLFWNSSQTNFEQGRMLLSQSVRSLRPE